MSAKGRDTFKVVGGIFILALMCAAAAFVATLGVSFVTGIAAVLPWLRWEGTIFVVCFAAVALMLAIDKSQGWS